MCLESPLIEAASEGAVGRTAVADIRLDIAIVADGAGGIAAAAGAVIAVIAVRAEVADFLSLL